MTDRETVERVAGRMLKELVQGHEGTVIFALPPGTNLSLGSLPGGGLLLSVSFPESHIGDTGLPGIKHE